ncbi:hypothetical protein SAMN02983003_3179 [Devosia enhydra]|uniref:Uncharacterized protein n=1 Tax=Devosia enhydra TaxID=665118 RepID=A0A1K2I174_9HYPH|nr:hypothetical protein [Devosia enhydra]SFZ86007.1 hypothetical protein SAMN02983003_3179 [Devosia enhydra]
MSAPVAWHASLPARPNGRGYGTDRGLNAHLFEPDSGFTRARRKAESQPNARRWAFDMSRAQYEIWETFWQDDLGGGIRPITFTDPVTANSFSAQVIGAPVEERLAPELWRVQLTLREL